MMCFCKTNGHWVHRDIVASCEDAFLFHLAKNLPSVEASTYALASGLNSRSTATLEPVTSVTPDFMSLRTFFGIALPACSGK